MMIANPAGAFMQGQEYAQRGREMKQQNALADLYRTQGAAISQGDPNALNALAQYDPQQAFGMRRQMAGDQRAEQQFGMSMQLDQARLAQIREQSKLQAAQAAQQLSAAELAEEARKLDGAMSAATAAYQQGPEGFAAFIQQNAAAIAESGMDPANVTFENFPAIASGLIGTREGLAEGMKAAQGFAPPKADTPLSPQGKLAADLNAGLITPEQFNAANEKTGMRVSSDGRGGFVFEQGVGVTGQEKPGINPSSPLAMIDTIDGILNDPALDVSTGILSPLQNVPGTPMKRFQGRANQLGGQAFLQAFESLKGAGQITEIEGAKATQAIGRLDSAQAPDDYRAALTELRSILAVAATRPKGWAETARARETAGNVLPADQVKSMSPDQIRALGPGGLLRLPIAELKGLSDEQWDAIEALAE